MTREERKDRLDAMRRLLWFLETNPDVPLPSFNFSRYVWNRKDLIKEARLLGSVRKEAGDGTYGLVKEFAPGVSIAIRSYQSAVCERKVVGQKWIEERPAQPATPGHYEDVYEYDCSTPILEGSDG